MKRINEYKKLFSIEEEIDLKDLKTKYRNLVKDWHPDKFQSDDEKFVAGSLRVKVSNAVSPTLSLALLALNAIEGATVSTVVPPVTVNFVEKPRLDSSCV